MDHWKNVSEQGKAWAFEEARKLVARFAKTPPAKGYCLFETGYGPSGLPHIGTFGEVARTTMVRKAFETISDIPTRLFCISDDMDGMRKVPDNLPQQEMLQQYLGKPLTVVPDPFGTHESFGHHMNARLRDFLDRFGFEYEFKSATDLYRGGAFDATLLAAAARYDAIMKIMIPTLGAERQATYSPFLPISPKTGNVLYVPMKHVDAEKGTVTFDDEDGTETTLPVTGGHCKLQWKPDFGMRWAALDVDFEMYGKDHLVNGKIYSAICRVLGGTPPEQFNYELFLDEKGEKISKSKGNGLTIEEWLTYAPTESLSLYMFQSPQRAKRLYFDVIPKAVDEYLTFLAKYPSQTPAEQVENPVWHIHAGNPPAAELPDISFALLLNLAVACNPEDKSVLWGFIGQYAAGATPEKFPMMDALAGYAVRYYHDFVKPNKKYRAATKDELAAIQHLYDLLSSKGAPEHKPAEEDYASYLMSLVYEVGRERYGKERMREWFQALYQVLLGQEKGPRMGSFIALYGLQPMMKLMEKTLRGESMAA